MTESCKEVNLESQSPMHLAKIRAVSRLAYNVDRAYCNAMRFLDASEWDSLSIDNQKCVMYKVLQYLSDPAIFFVPTSDKSPYDPPDTFKCTEGTDTRHLLFLGVIDCYR